MHRNQARNAIEWAIDQLSKCTIELKTTLNLHSPSTALPPEILSEIFMLAAGIHAKGAAAADSNIPTMRDLVRPSHVCKQWRSIALGCPTLWSFIDLRHPPEWVAELLARSKGAPLYVFVTGRKGKSYKSLDAKKWVKETLGMVLMSLERIRDLKLVVTPRLSEAQEVLKLLDGPAPLLEALAIVDMFSRTRVEEQASRLLRRAESRGLRRLHLKHCDTVSWEHIVLHNLTHLKVENHTRYMGLTEFLGALSRMPRLEELVVAGALTPGPGNTPALLFPTQIALPRLRSIQLLRGYVTASAHLLNNLATPSLSHMTVALQQETVYETHEADAAAHVALLPAMAAKVPTLSKFLTLSIERLVGGNTAISAYREAYAKDTDEDIPGWLDGHAPVLQLTSHALTDDAVFEAFCALFPVEDILSLVLQGGIPSQQAWQSLVERTTLVRELHVLNVYAGNSIPERLLERIQEEPERIGEEPTWHYALPGLRLLTLERVHFDEGGRSSGDSQTSTVDRLADCLVQRFKNGAEIESVRIKEARYMTERDFKVLWRTVRVAGYDGELRQLDGQLEGDENPELEGEIPQLDEVYVDESTEEEDSDDDLEDEEFLYL